MQRLWFITNPHSGSSDAAKAEAILAIFVERGLTLAGRTDFPDDDLPTPGALAKAEADTVVLFAGDGTINASVCALAEWDGAILVLPGGTMNMLAKSLHGDADPAAILLAAHENERRIALPFVEAGKHRALVGLIVGPAANWYHARERIRERRLTDLWPAVRTAWRRTFGRGIRLAGAPGFPVRAQAAYVRADGDGLAIMAIDARDFRSVTDLGWNLITGDWVAAQAVTEIRAHRLTIAERRPVLALFDGEPVMLDPSTVISAGRTREQFIATKAAA
jgi:diacylglycerol kinase family enzyme